jgi:hypothetical protein
VAAMEIHADDYLRGMAFHEAGCHSACNIDPLSRGIGVQN